MPVALVLLTAVPAVAGSLRLVEIGGDPEVTAQNARFLADPVPIAVHIVSAVVFCGLGALQFVPRLRRRRAWHRVAGRFLAPAGVVAALSGVWVSAFRDRAPSDGDLLTAVRLVVGPAMAVCLVLGVVAIRRRDVPRHRAWMIRGYALGQGAGTQVFVLAPWTLALGEPGQLARALLMAAAWALNLAVAEWFIRRPSRSGAAGPRAAVPPAPRAPGRRRGR
ncbi:DUF2306 domain-containing protein [Kineococcus sp. NUM-3379]